MKVLWLCNMMPGAVRESLGGASGGGLWVDHVLSDLRKQEHVTLRILCPGPKAAVGSLDDRTDYRLFTEGEPYRYLPELEAQFGGVLSEFQPDVIHVWGTEYGHTLAMVRAAQKLGVSGRIAVSIQGLCSVYAGHYAEGIPERVKNAFTLRDVLRRDNMAMQQKKFALRGKLEVEALEGVRHVIGRTDWDRACTMQMNPDAKYHFCNETLREAFYEGGWSYDSCKKHRIFASSCLYPIKGFHYLLEAMPIILRRYPDTVISVTGGSFFADSFLGRLRQQTYFRYLQRFCRRNGLTDKIEFLGQLNAEAMKRAFLDANVFVLPSTIENSPNSLGEAMLLGVPCVASDVGGVTNMLHPGEGYVYPSTAPYMLAHDIMEVFAMEDRAAELGAAARAHARKTHDPEKNLRDLLAIYREIADQGAE